MPTEIIESKEIYRGFIALRLATMRLVDGARVRSENIEHGKARAVLPYDTRPFLGAALRVSLHGLSETRPQPCGPSGLRFG
jgi:hypothetical protein